MPDRVVLALVEGWRWCAAKGDLVEWREDYVHGCRWCVAAGQWTGAAHERLYRSSAELPTAPAPQGQPAWVYCWVDWHDASGAAALVPLLNAGWEPCGKEHDRSGRSRLHLRRRADGA